MFLIVWDKLFGTFTAEDKEDPVEYGTVKNVEYSGYLDIVFNEYTQIIKDTKQKISFKQKLKYVFGPPGYGHNGEPQNNKATTSEK